jgi:hypothetical protein
VLVSDRSGVYGYLRDKRVVGIYYFVRFRAPFIIIIEV